MAAVPIILYGSFTFADGETITGTFNGTAAYSDRHVGGGPLPPQPPVDPDYHPPGVGEGLPGGPPGIWGGPGGLPKPPAYPAHPIVIPPTPPTVDPPVPAHPIVLPPPVDPPTEPPGSGATPEGWFWHWQDPPGQWLLVYNPPGGGKPKPPG